MGANCQVLVNETVGFAGLGFEFPEGFDPMLTPDELLFMQDKYLIEQLRLLNDQRASDESKSDALDWVAMPLVLMPEVKHLGPLSFQRCCLEAHGADPSIIQERVLREVAPERLSVLGYE